MDRTRIESWPASNGAKSKQSCSFGQMPGYPNHDEGEYSVAASTPASVGLSTPATPAVPAAGRKRPEPLVGGVQKPMRTS
jgi:hypothetical protein